MEFARLTHPIKHAQFATVGAFRQSMRPETEDHPESSSLAKSSFTATPEVANHIVEALQATGYLSFRNLRVEMAGGLAVLRGRVPTYYLKQKLQAVALTASGVDKVLNELEVASVKDRRRRELSGPNDVAAEAFWDNS